MKVDFRMVSPEALQAIIETFVQREGTDYGQEYSMESKVNQVKQQLQQGSAFLSYEPDSETINILPADTLVE